MKYFQFKGVLQKSGWFTPAFVGVDELGKLQYFDSHPPKDATAIEYVNGFAVPGFMNAHSHAFQFGMAGMAETHVPGTNDDFWSWRENMYRCALGMDPDEMQVVATMLYAEMLRNGYTHVAEFHYLHHDQNGKPYSNIAETGERLLAAAETAGIRITLVPVFYQMGGFGVPAHAQQKRFISKSVDEYLQLLDDTATAVAKYKHASLGFGVHSLRAVNAADIIQTFNDGPPTLPFHLHAAEQLQEVDDCIAFLGKRPVAWLLDNLNVNERFHLIHCTHLDDDEVRRLAQSKANVVLCPSTEGNLGDGIFRLTDFYRADGSWSIGTDSHISLNPLEDLRWLDYAQRFTTHKRNTFDDGARVLYDTTLRAGRMAMGIQDKEYFKIGNAFDAVVFDANSPLISQAPEQSILSAIIYTASPQSIFGTLVNGDWIVRNGVHRRDAGIKSAFNGRK